MSEGHILVGVTGGIAAYKAVHVVRQLIGAGYQVRVVPTENALRMVGAATWEAVTGYPVVTDPFVGADEVLHVKLGSEAIGALIVPATANFVAKYAAGIADDMLTTTLLTCTCPVMVTPAMHHQMWDAPSTQHNISLLRSREVHIMEPAVGALTSGDAGRGRLPEPTEIVQEFLAVLSRTKTGSTTVDSSLPLSGQHVVVTLGGTKEPIDPVRYIGNRSSGRQGMAIATQALAAGARVTVIAAHHEVSAPAGVTVVSAPTALKMQAAIAQVWDDLDVLVMAAAVADYRPAEYHGEKLKKASGKLNRIELVENPDVLAHFGHLERGSRFLVGFAAETLTGEDAKEAAQAKIFAKRVDLLALNLVGESTGFGDVPNSLIMMDSAGEIVAQFAGTKIEVAQALINQIVLARESREES
ncbi:bifunctional phosphopantothenoylcysteine decarboxylase/phosphopantothenate--cysteine ligase CoaBC [Boudabousia marimammalium]|uniref:Coenzyme A biosynthesis bifunctional protein CoaBC n=1 Tax=Boudabousia marimammalium TaxID=156892 RepID=A0A1Q5PRA0_9ACTO|nr:bifunctional phosphopantothenoylcysteine decarboxylase/phosphopantothenate--cysteine ligase CoaBC [Boudabousia marimammalium]OKL50002.1 hypothetical protein BM477_03665 [Boudabousia marimammalium]